MFNKKSQYSDHEIVAQAMRIRSKMTLKEKVWLLNGNWDPIKNHIKYKNAYNPVPIATNGCKRLGVEPIKFTDGPRGVVMGNSTCFPVSMARGASFDVDLEHRIGDVIGKESRAGGANYFAGVCINLLRHPAWGRAQETYSEDPFHLGEMGKALTESVQKHNVMACIKHYAVNNIENSRFRLNVTSDERTLREVYLPHFKKSVDAGAASLMGAYNLYEGDQCCESRHLLTEILRDEWGFEGFTSSDFIFGIRDGVKAIKAGMDVEMPTPIEYNKKLLKAVENGVVDESIVDEAVLRVLKTVMVFNESEDPMVYTKELIACESHIELAREVAEKSMVLIKNHQNILPLDKTVKKILVIGKLAAKANIGDYGSSRIYAPYVVSPLDGLKSYLGDEVEINHCLETEIDRAKILALESDVVLFVVGNDYNDEGEAVVPDDQSEVSMTALLAKGYANQGAWIKAALMRKNAKKEKASSYTSSESGTIGGDRENLSLKSEEINIIKAVTEINSNVVVSLVSGSMIMIDDWAEGVSGIIYSWYSGMEGGNALAKILFGEVNPSGRLPFSIPVSTEQLPYFSSTDDEIRYDLYHGYSYLDKNGYKAKYPFGYGLSYTTFSYGDPTIELMPDNLRVKVPVSNRGSVSGEEVVQVYIGKIDSCVERQKKILKGFKKVKIEPNGTEQVIIEIDYNDLRYYSNEERKWCFENGDYRIMVGPNADDTSLNTSEMDINRIENL